MKDTISDWEILLIRQCKKNKYNINNFRRLVGKRCAIPYEHVNKSDVVHFLAEIVIDYGLIRNWTEFLLNDLNPIKWYDKNNPVPYVDNLIKELATKIMLTEIKKFPRYRSPARFRNNP